MRSLTGLSVRSVTRRKGRYVLTLAGVALGVAVLFAVLAASNATTRGFDEFVQGISGRADVVVSPSGAFDASLPPDADAKLRSLPGVAAVSGEVTLRSHLTNVRTQRRSEDEAVFVRGIDLPTARTVRDFFLSDGRFPADGAPEIAVADRVKGDLRVGTTTEIATTSGLHQVKVVGILADRGAGLSDNGEVAYTSLPFARTLVPGPPGWSDVSVVLGKGVDRTAWIDAHQDDVPSAAMQDASDIAGDFRSFVNAISGGMVSIGAIALFVAAFLIFLTFSVAVAERSRLYGTLRALGATPKQVRQTVLREALVIAAVAVDGGLLLGYALASLCTSLVGHLLRLHIPSIGVPTGSVATAVIVGILVTVAATVLPARRASRMAPVAAMSGRWMHDARPTSPWIGLSLVVVGTAISFVVQSSAGSMGLLFLLLGDVLLIPSLLSPVARFVGRVTRRRSPGVGGVAVLHLVKERSRSAYTLGLVMVVLTLTLSVAAANLAMRSSLDKVLDRQFGADLAVFAPGSADPAVGRSLARLPGVAAATEMRFGRADVLDRGTTRRMFLVMVDPASYFRFNGFAWVDGDNDTARAALARGGSVLLPAPVAKRMGVARGGTVPLRTTLGVRPFRVAGTFSTVGQQPSVVAGLPDGRAYLGAGPPNGFLLDVAKGHDPEAVRAAIFTPANGQPSLGQQFALSVDSAAQTRARARAQMQGFFGLVYAILIVSGIIGLLGLANTLVMSVIQRTREIGVLRATGAHRRQIRGMVLVESATLVLVAYGLALALAAVVSALMIRGFASTLEFTLPFAYPWALLPFLLIGAVLIAGLACLAPARRAAGIEVAAALRFD
jgi:putative ABC transport system permease protein